jgi:hypothetical protein
MIPTPHANYEQRVCADCGMAFTMTEREVVWFQRRELELPRRCQVCRKRRRSDVATPPAADPKKGTV